SLEFCDLYYSLLEALEQKGCIVLPRIHADASNNAHMLYLVCRNGAERNSLIKDLRQHNINAVFHYLSLHASPFYKQLYSGEELKNSNHFSDCLVRLPMYFELGEEDVKRVTETVNRFYQST